MSASSSSPAAQPVPPSAPTTSVPQPPAPRRRLLSIFFTVLILLALAWLAWWFFVLRNEESTDDAYVAGNVVRVMPQVGGRAAQVLADDTDHVQAGQVLVRLDPVDAELALDKALVELALVVRDICRLQAQLRESVTQVQVAETNLRQASANLQRREALGRQNAVRVEELHDYRIQVQNNLSLLKAARHRQDALSAQLLEGPLAEQPRVRQAAARVRECWLALQRTQIRSPVTGQVAQRAVQAGAVVAPGGTLMAIIPLEGVWIDANFKENQLRRMRIGQPATVRVDLHGASAAYTGRVAGFAAGTGSAFALIPPQNATGNWIKIVQRVPVRIEIDAKALRAHPLLIGLSSTVSVDITNDTGPLLLDTARQRPLPPVLTASGQEADMAPIEATISRVIADNTTAAD